MCLILLEPSGPVRDCTGIAPLSCLLPFTSQYDQRLTAIATADKTRRQTMLLGTPELLLQISENTSQQVNTFHDATLVQRGLSLEYDKVKVSRDRPRWFKGFRVD